MKMQTATMKRVGKLALSLATLSLLGACASVSKRVDLNPLDASPSKHKQFADKLQTMPGEQSTEGLDPIGKAAFWGTRYDREPTNPDVIVKFSQSLRAIGSNQESLKVMMQATQRVTPTAAMNLEMGKVLIANDRAFEAVRPIEQALKNGEEKNWQAWSAYGVALDKIGEHREAQSQYRQAMKLNPDAVSVLNNLGLSYALQGDLYRAESTLRQAVAMPGGTARTRQNLALVLSLAGKKDEAERLARSDLPPKVADNNASYYRGLMTQPAYWQGLSADNADLPDFDAPATAPSVPVETTPVTPKPLPPYKEPVPKPQNPQTLSSSDPLDEVYQSLAEEDPQLIEAPKATGQPLRLENTSYEEEETQPKPKKGKAGS